LPIPSEAAGAEQRVAEIVVRALRSPADRGAAVLVATHDEWVADAADRVVELRPSA
jgi:ABC-type lipoprotein export system ATPase subunit